LRPVSLLSGWASVCFPAGGAQGGRQTPKLGVPGQQDTSTHTSFSPSQSSSLAQLVVLLQNAKVEMSTRRSCRPQHARNMRNWGCYCTSPNPMCRTRYPPNRSTLHIQCRCCKYHPPDSSRRGRGSDRMFHWRRNCRQAQRTNLRG
jgi:hypothetical protein